MNFRQIEQFIAVVRTGSITQAAKQLYTTQPSLSRSIATLEDELGLPLFTRTGKQIKINEAGLVVLRYFEEIIANLRTMNSTLSDLQAGTVGNVRVGISYAALNPDWQQDIVRNFFLTHPQVSLCFFQMDQDELFQRLSSRDLDFGISSTTPDLPNITWIKLYTEEIGVLIGRDNPLAEKPALCLSDLRDEPFHIINANSDFKRMAFRFFERAGIYPPIATQVDFPNVVGELIAGGRGFTLVAQERHQTLSRTNPGQDVMLQTVYRPLKEPMSTRTCCIGYNTKRFMPTAAANLLEQFLHRFDITTAAREEEPS